MADETRQTRGEQSSSPASEMTRPAQAAEYVEQETSADVAAAVAYLKSKDGGAVKSVFTVGFCFGGSSSWNQSALTEGLNGCIGFYGRPERSLPFGARG